MTLAHHFHRAGKPSPIRYAVDPAIRNYLAIASRAMGVPDFLRGLLTVSEHHPHPLGSLLPTAQEMGRTFLGEHDPGSLSALLDMLGEHGITPSYLPTLHHNITGYGQGQAGAHPAVTGGFGENVLRNPSVLNHIGRLIGQPQEPARVSIGSAISNLLSHLNNSEPGHPLRTPLVGHAAGLLGGGRLMDAVPLHDLTGELQERPDNTAGMTRTYAHTAQRSLQNLLANHMQPTLWHFGQHGALPQ